MGGALRAAITLDVSSGSPDGVRLPQWFMLVFYRNESIRLSLCTESTNRLRLNAVSAFNRGCQERSRHKTKIESLVPA